MTGYSSSPLARKLGISEDTTVVILEAPQDYATIVAPLPAGARITTRVPRRPEFVHVFATSRRNLTGHLKRLRATIAENGVVWVSWPKKSSRVPTDITEDTIREVALPLGFVDIKVCAVSDIWSGLKLMIRRELRRLR